MKMIKRITDSDIIGGPPELMDTITRYGARGVLIDNELNIAMMHMSKPDLYKLPGGGMEEGETREKSFLREVKEETGYEAEIIYELGYIEEHKKKNDFMQLSYCYIAKASNIFNTVNLNENESQLGMTVKWMTLDKALLVMRESSIKCNDYSTKFMILRDKAILENAVNFLNDIKDNLNEYCKLFKEGADIL